MYPAVAPRCCRYSTKASEHDVPVLLDGLLVRTARFIYDCAHPVPRCREDSHYGARRGLDAHLVASLRHPPSRGPEHRIGQRDGGVGAEVELNVMAVQVQNPELIDEIAEGAPSLP